MAFLVEEESEFRRLGPGSMNGQHEGRVKCLLAEINLLVSRISDSGRLDLLQQEEYRGGWNSVIAILAGRCHKGWVAGGVFWRRVWISQVAVPQPPHQ